MRKLLNSLYVTSHGSSVLRQGESVVVKVEDEVRIQVPVATLQSIVCFGPVFVSPPALELLGEAGVSLSFLSDSGRFIARMQGPVSGNVLLRREQFARTADEGCREALARSVIIGKVANSRTVLQRGLRDHSPECRTSRLEKGVAELGVTLAGLRQEQSIEALRGREGEAAACYFGAFDDLVVAQKGDFHFQQRSRRPPLDNINALLSFVYALLQHDVASALEAVGLDPACGFLHSLRPGRMALALDLMEELRPCIADRLVLSLVNLQKVKGSGFTRSESGGVSMDDRTRREVIVSYQKRKQEELLHPFTGEHTPVGLIPHVQATLLARHLRGELDAYPPFIWK
jgi:CRISPR-associated protein Cas1